MRVDRGSCLNALEWRMENLDLAGRDAAVFGQQLGRAVRRLSRPCATRWARTRLAAARTCRSCFIEHGLSMPRNPHAFGVTPQSAKKLCVQQRLAIRS